MYPIYSYPAYSTLCYILSMWLYLVSTCRTALQKSMVEFWCGWTVKSSWRNWFKCTWVKAYVSCSEGASCLSQLRRELIEAGSRQMPVHLGLACTQHGFSHIPSSILASRLFKTQKSSSNSWRIRSQLLGNQQMNFENPAQRPSPSLLFSLPNPPTHHRVRSSWPSTSCPSGWPALCLL